MNLGSETLFSVGNKHIADSGQPIPVDGNTKGRYHGYFENEYGEQAIFVYNYQAGTGTLWMGDVGWEEPKLVVDGQVPDLILGENEKLWLMACWSAASAGRQKRKINGA